MCETESVVSLLYEALQKAYNSESVTYANDREKEALLEAINRAIRCAKNVTHQSQINKHIPY